MAKADAVEVDFNGGERSGTRWANSNITVNLVQFDQQLSVTVRLGQKTGSASTREFDDDSLKAMVDEATEAAKAARDNPNLPPLTKGPQDYIPVDAALPRDGQLRPGRARARWCRKSVDVCDKKGALGSGYIPKTVPDDLQRELEGLFAYYQYAEAGFDPDLPHAGRQAARAGPASPASRTSSLIDRDARSREVAADKALKSQKPRALEPGRYTVILEPRAARASCR